MMLNILKCRPFLCRFFLLIVLCGNLIKADKIEDIPENGQANVINNEMNIDPFEDEPKEIKNSTILDGLSKDQLEQLSKTAKEQDFNTQQDRLMKLIINSLYRNKEIFLRELISNGCDAIDKIRHESLVNPSILGENTELSIRIKVDEDNNMIHITDSGIGMTADHLKTYLGTIAKSQTSEFLKSVEQAETKDGRGAVSDLIGQFGVGFYSAFLVADKVIVTSKHNDDTQYIWESDSKHFKVMKDPRGNSLKRGTTVSLVLKPEAREYIDLYKLRNIVSKYSQFVNYPIYLWTHKEVEEEEENVEDVVDAQVTDEDKKPSKVKKTVWFWDHVNDVQPIWQRKPSDVTKEEYVNFYKALTKRDEEPLLHVHFYAEGDVNFKAIAYVPKKAPPVYATTLNRANNDNFKLYVRRVFITDRAEMTPSYLNFVVGIVDSDDLTLNISREELQQNKFIQIIKKKVTRKILDMLKSLNQEDYEAFWKEFGTNIKFGMNEDSLNRIRLAKMMRFYSSVSTANDKQNFTSLKEYVDRRKENQSSIYFVSERSISDAKNSPFTEKLVDEGYEVLYLIDPVDQICLQNLPEFQSLKFQNVAKEGMNISSNGDQKNELERFEPLIRWLEESFSDKIIKVLISDRLVRTPMIFITSQWGYDGAMERISKAQAYQKVGGDSATVHFANMKRKMEINTKHPIIKEMLRRVKLNKSDKQLREIAEICVDTALLRSGYDIRDPAMYGKRVEAILGETMELSNAYSMEPDDNIEFYQTRRRRDLRSSSSDNLKESKKYLNTKQSTKKSNDEKNQKKNEMNAKNQKKNELNDNKQKKNELREKNQKKNELNEKNQKKNEMNAKNQKKNEMNAKNQKKSKTSKDKEEKIKESKRIKKLKSPKTNRTRSNNQKINLDDEKFINLSQKKQHVKDKPNKNDQITTITTTAKERPISTKERPISTKERSSSTKERSSSAKERPISAKERPISDDDHNNSDDKKKSADSYSTEKKKRIKIKNKNHRSDDIKSSPNERPTIYSLFNYLLESVKKSLFSDDRKNHQNSYFNGFAMASATLISDTKNTDEISDDENNLNLPEGVKYDGNKLLVGYRYRYRISNFLSSSEGRKWSKSLNKTFDSVDSGLDKPNQRTIIKKPHVGSKYKYRISNYLKTLNADDIMKLRHEGFLTPTILTQTDKQMIDIASIHNSHSKLLITHLIDCLKKLLTYQHCVQWKNVEVDEKPTPAVGNPLFNKIGYKYRYRLSRKIKAKQEKKANRISAKWKPHNIGFEYRYRTSIMLKKLNITYEQMIHHMKKNSWLSFRKNKEKELFKPHQPKISDKLTTINLMPDDLVIDLKKLYPPEIISVGFQYRYRRSRKMAALNISFEEVEKRRASFIKQYLKKKALLNLNDDDDEVSHNFVLNYSKLTPDEKQVGYEYRYRISRKFKDKLPKYILNEQHKRPKVSKKNKKKSSKKIKESNDRQESIKDYESIKYNRNMGEVCDADQVVEKVKLPTRQQIPSDVDILMTIDFSELTNIWIKRLRKEIYSKFVNFLQ